MKYVQQRIQGLLRKSRKLRGRRSGQGVRWPKDFQEKAVALMIQGEMTADQLSGRLRITSNTLRVWRKAFGKKSNGGGFKRLKVVDGPKPKNQSKSPVKIFVTTPHGSEVHGLTAHEVASLIRRGVL